jgi:hypothetical protein
MNKVITYFILLLFTVNLYGQDSIKKVRISVFRNYINVIKVPITSEKHKHRITFFSHSGFPKVKYSDTLTVYCDYGFNGESIGFKDKDSFYKSDSLYTNMIVVLAGRVLIPKKKGMQFLTICLNNNELRTFRLKKRFSSMHIDLERNKHRLKCKYWKREQFYL